MSLLCDIRIVYVARGEDSVVADRIRPTRDRRSLACRDRIGVKPVVTCTGLGPIPETDHLRGGGCNAGLRPAFLEHRSTGKMVLLAIQQTSESRHSKFGGILEKPRKTRRAGGNGRSRVRLGQCQGCNWIGHVAWWETRQ